MGPGRGQLRFPSAFKEDKGVPPPNHVVIWGRGVKKKRGIPEGPLFFFGGRKWGPATPRLLSYPTPRGGRGVEAGPPFSQGDNLSVSPIIVMGQNYSAESLAFFVRFLSRYRSNR